MSENRDTNEICEGRELNESELENVSGGSGANRPHNVYFVCRGCRAQFSFWVPGAANQYVGAAYIYTHFCGTKTKIRPEGNIWIGEPVY